MNGIVVGSALFLAFTLVVVAIGRAERRGSGSRPDGADGGSFWFVGGVGGGDDGGGGDGGGDGGGGGGD
jgi:hypothetical protein